VAVDDQAMWALAQQGSDRMRFRRRVAATAEKPGRRSILTERSPGGAVEMVE
jgi:hypothetical protein